MVMIMNESGLSISGSSPLRYTQKKKLPKTKRKKKMEGPGPPRFLMGKDIVQEER